jgi:hypothetical protein
MIPKVRACSTLSVAIGATARSARSRERRGLVRTQVTEAVEWLYGHIEHIPAQDRVGIGVVRIGDAAVAYKTNWLADPLDYATSDADRAEAWASFPTGC